MPSELKPCLIDIKIKGHIETHLLNDDSYNDTICALTAEDDGLGHALVGRKTDGKITCPACLNIIKIVTAWNRRSSDDKAK